MEKATYTATANSARLKERTAHAARTSWAQGRFPPHPAKDVELSCTRGAFHRWSCSVRICTLTRGWLPTAVSQPVGPEGAFFQPHDQRVP